MKRVKILDGETPILAKRYLTAEYNSSLGLYYFKQFGECKILILDSNGRIINSIDKKRFNNYDCFEGSFNLNWAKKNKSLFLYYTNHYFEPKFIFYDVINDIISSEYNIFSKVDTLFNGNCYKPTYIENNNQFLLWLA